MVIRIRIPAPSSMAVANLLAVLGLVAIVVAAGGLWGAWVATMVGGVITTGLGWVGMTQAAAAERTASTPAAAPVDEHQAVVEQLPVASPAAEAAAA